MFKNLIENYINNMTINDIIIFANKENIKLKDYEYVKIYNYIKNNWNELIKNDNLIKSFITNNLELEHQKEVYELFLKYKKKYANYL